MSQLRSYPGYNGMPQYPQYPQQNTTTRTVQWHKRWSSSNAWQPISKDINILAILVLRMAFKIPQSMQDGRSMTDYNGFAYGGVEVAQTPSSGFWSRHSNMQSHDPSPFASEASLQNPFNQQYVSDPRSKPVSLQ